MYFILNEYQDKVLYFFETFEELDKGYKLYKFTESNEGLWGYSVGKYGKHYFVKYASFQTKEYTDAYAMPPKGVQVCTKYLVREHRKRIIEKLLN